MSRGYKSLKPGRGPSFMGGVGSVISIIFGIIWTAMAVQISAGAPGGIGSIFPLFGILFIVAGIVNAIYHFRNATSPERYSLMDITYSESEPDPLNEKYGRRSLLDGDASSESESASDLVRAGAGGERTPERPKGNRFCPYCGQAVAEDYRFCPSCGRDLPD